MTRSCSGRSLLMERLQLELGKGFTTKAARPIRRPVSTLCR
ncbi:hypothetical protein ALSL_2536 [Aerosticca soli]|uniref:Uncharacterized protein n=1 Tax=Aerosticca soli TaxID=2010829 RepID=A0A2Z6E7P9_9GAMM|nr:hypothetical protein ALSL_2536 [Aerosticca soli]